ncbi:MAG: hypothetical protein ACP5HS_09570 [Anaerolineae bacterium]
MRRRVTWFLVVAVLMVPLRTPARAEIPPHLGYGMMLAFPPEHLRYVREAGFDWFKYFVRWDEVDGNRDRVYTWDTVDWRLNEACENELNLLLRVERDTLTWAPIADHEMAAWEAFFRDLAAHIAQYQTKCGIDYRVALEVWNEPNLGFQWGNQPVDPTRYTEMVKRAYVGAKAGDPHSIVVAGSLAPTGGTADGFAVNDVTFLEAMYIAGLKGYFDAISIHNYGFGGPPEDKDWGSGILNFRRAEDIHATMVAHGDGDKPVWGTEFGWLLESATCSSYWHDIGFAWQQVTAAQQADYLSRAFAYAHANWPWMQVMIVSNLDFSVMPWYGECDPLRYFAVLEPDKTPRLAYTALAQMPKYPRSWAPAGMAVSPTALAWMLLPTETRILSHTVTVLNTGELPFRWTVTAESALPIALSPTEGDAGEAFTAAIDARALPLGTYSATLTITADEPEVPESPLDLPVHVYVVERIYKTHLPLVQRAH